MQVLVTGGCGFIGSNFIRYVLSRDPSCRVINLDALTYAGNPANLDDIKDDPRYRFVRGNIADPAAVRPLVQEVSASGGAVMNFAAESHVDRSIQSPAIFVRTNVLGTQVLLDACREFAVGRFVQVSTDEVYGSLGPDGSFSEESLLRPNSPYAASKAAADHLVHAYWHTYGLPALITRCSNNYGPYQSPEKLIPLMITRALEDRPLPVYGDGLHIRDWLHVEDHCAALLQILREGRPGEVYNIGADQEQTNLRVVRVILEVLGKPESLIAFVADRPGHDRRYAIDAGKLRRELGWKPRWDFGTGLRETIRWYADRRTWVAEALARTPELATGMPNFQ
jgi:dTDP-glucose 4,6-dehydratase